MIVLFINEHLSMKNLDLELATEQRGEMATSLSGSQPFPVNLEKIDNAVEYMVQNMGKRLPISTLACVANISPSYFFSIFKQRTGCSPLVYYTRLRMGRACLLLDSTSVRVKDVAEALGYDDVFYFSRVFKSCTTIPPSHYRNLGADLRMEIKRRLGPNNEKPLSPAAPGAMWGGKANLVDNQQSPGISQGYTFRQK